MMEQQRKLEEVQGVGNIWNPTEIKEIEGVFVRDEKGTFGTNYVLKCPSGEEFLVFGTTVLNTKMSRVELNKYVRITYLGEIKSKDGRMYKDFKVEVEK